jgi:uncharacterized protein
MAWKGKVTDKSTLGSFWLAFGATLQPFYNASGAYSPDPTKPWLGATEATFAASFGAPTIFFHSLPN